MTRISKRLINDSKMWNKLLGEFSYLNEKGSVVENRIKTAYEWGIGDKLFLNIGSGQGFLENYFYKKGKLNFDLWISVDISKTGLARISKQYGVNTLQASIINMPIKSNTFDCVYCLEVLEHLDKSIIESAYNEILRVTKEGGKIIISVPVYKLSSIKEHIVGHMRKYTPDIIESEMIKNKITILEKKNIYAFNSLNSIKTSLCERFNLRRPSVSMYLGKKRDEDSHAL